MIGQNTQKSEESYTVSVRLAVIAGVLRLAFPPALAVDFDDSLWSYDVGFSQAIAVAAHLGLCVPISRLELGGGRVLIENQRTTMDITDSWLCPHCKTRFNDTATRLTHVFLRHVSVMTRVLNLYYEQD